MKTKKIIPIILIVLVAAAGWLLLKRQPTVSTRETQKDIYYCPMHPQYTSDRPGTCPICYMKLVKKEDAVKNTSSHLNHQKVAKGESVDGYSNVSIDVQRQQLIGVKTAPVTKKPLVKTIHAYGYVAHDLELYEDQLEYIDAWRVYYAFVVRRPVKESFRPDWWRYQVTPSSEGRSHSKDKREAQQRLIKAEYELRHMGLTDTQLEQLRQVKFGQPWVQPDLLFFEKNQPFWIYAQILESDLGFVAPGQKVIAKIPAYHQTAEGIVRSIAPFVDPVTRTSRVRIEMPKYPGELSVNMFVNVDIPVELDNSLVVPREAIMDTGLNKIVFIKTAEGVFEPRTVTTGFEGDGMVAVESGLKEGETIVVSGNFLLDSESRLQASIAGGGHQHD